MTLHHFSAYVVCNQYMVKPGYTGYVLGQDRFTMIALKILTAIFLLRSALSEEVVYKGDDAEFHKYLNKLHVNIQVNELIKVKVQAKVHEDILKIKTKVAEYDPCFNFEVQFKGSSFEELKIGYPDEFDFGLLNKEWTGKIGLVETATTPGFGYAFQKETNCLKKYLIPGKKYIDPAKVRSHLRELVDKAFTDLNLRGHIVRAPWEGGPAVTFEFKSEEKEFKEISIDLAIGIDLLNWPPDARNLSDDVKKSRAQLVPKVSSQPNTGLWQISFSQVERKIMQSIDNDGGCRKKVLQLAKHFKMGSMGKWFSLASYHLKTVMLHLNEEKKKPGDWAQTNLVPRFRDLITKLLSHLESGSLPSFFIKKYDVFDGKPDLPSAIKGVQDFLKTLRDKPESFLPKPKPGAKSDEMTFDDFQDSVYKIYV